MSGDGSAWSGARRGRWHEPEAITPPDPRLPDVRRLQGLAARRARLADAAAMSATMAMTAATLALQEAEQALIEQIAHVAAERVRLREERQAEAGAAASLQLWRHREDRLIGSVDPRREAVARCRQSREDAEVELFDALERQRALNRRKEKYGLLIDQLVDAGA